MLKCYFNKKKKIIRVRLKPSTTDLQIQVAFLVRQRYCCLISTARIIAYCWKILPLTIKSQSVDSWRFEGWKKFKHEHEKWKMEVVRNAHRHLIV